MVKPSEQCKAAGLKGLAELAKITDQSEQTLNNWSKKKPQLFKVVVIGAAKVKKMGNAKMKIFAKDIINGEAVNLTAQMTTDHCLSRYNQPIMIIDEWADQDSNVMSYDNWILAGCGVTDYGSDQQRELFERWIGNLVAMLPGAKE